MNNTNTSDARAIDNYIAAKNEEFSAECKAQGATFWLVSALTADNLTEYGVNNPEEYKNW